MTLYMLDSLYKYAQIMFGAMTHVLIVIVGLAQYCQFCDM